MRRWSRTGSSSSASRGRDEPRPNDGCNHRQYRANRFVSVFYNSSSAVALQHALAGIALDYIIQRGATHFRHNRLAPYRSFFKMQALLRGHMPVKEKRIPLAIGTLRVKKTKHLWAFERWGKIRSLKLGDYWLIWHPNDFKPKESDLCMIHIGKTGGTALKSVLSHHNKMQTTDPIELYRHEMTLPILVNSSHITRALFFVRDPVSRFVSAFNSRLRRDPRKKKVN